MQSLENKKFTRIATPDNKKSIYGIAATEVLNNTNLKIDNKLLFVSTVPQTASYVISREVDAGFVNLSEALSIQDKIGGIYKIDENLYKEISIVAFVLQPCNKNKLCNEFLEFLNSDKAKAIVNKYGL
ncbi:molybdate ABC transporter substrate-binding protein [Campylobacter sp. RM12327]|uniref:molybdate ABC transporter substrate-binding protein n=1 Tax=Campylobacter sputorum TaxID=206 RepID=UPI000B78440F|nr:MULTISPECIES: molybdate ABC transporter substrate-binding protein [Campylobacter]MBE7358314.1 molybdate ABC transporter substrate-binding protein [Campylobacter sp. RM11302]MBF6669476.1 molybdate ABC transporter substrate-binding protein [Campylobacter sp. RM12327]MBF6674781.1 molybdate ABC transporter substrate-binding protein [Campylobacter sp. RM13538]MBF6676611.1 molybdate ABC transporter substrate-binding protein [Campylobacter sp. RM12321]MBF6677952.1 molybdate ABC transporter substra